MAEAGERLARLADAVDRVQRQPRQQSAQLPPLSLHGLRHSWATMALSNNIHVRVVQERLGHSTAQITPNTYSHVGPTLHREAAETIAAGLFG